MNKAPTDTLHNLTHSIVETGPNSEQSIEAMAAYITQKIVPSDTTKKLATDAYKRTREILRLSV